MRFRSISILILGLCPALVVSAQEIASTRVSGLVTSVAGVPLDAVEVQLINLRSGRITTRHSNLAGEFSFDELRSGRFSLGFMHDDYAAKRIGPFELLPDSPLEVNAELELLAPPLTRPRAGLDTIALEYGMAREQIAAVPVMIGSEGRTSVDKLSLLVPGLTPVESLEINAFSGTASAVSANGSRRSAVNYQLDGAPNNAQNRITGSQAASYAPAPEAVETFRVVSHTYSASEGRNAGAIVAARTREGGELWHGHLRGFWRPRMNELESFDGSTDSLSGWAGGGQAGGPIWRRKKLYLFVDAEGWITDHHRTSGSPTLTNAERAGDLSALDPLPLDPATGAPFPNGVIPSNRLDPLMQTYLDAFLPGPNVGETVYRSSANLDADGQMFLARLDQRLARWTLGLSYIGFRNNVLDGIPDSATFAPGALLDRRQNAHNAQFSAAHAPSPNFVQSFRLSGQRLSIAAWQGDPEFRGVTANEIGFDFASFGANPGTIPDVTLLDDNGFERIHIAPFLSSESSVQTTWQANYDMELRRGPVVVRGGALYERGGWPFTHTENFGGSFTFPGPPEPPIRALPNGVRDLLLGSPGEYRIQTPRSLNMRWHQFALYGEAELRFTPNLLLTLGIRYERQPPAHDTQDRIGAFRRGEKSVRFPETLSNLIFPGDEDPGFGTLPRSTTATKGDNLGPRVGIAFSPGSDNALSRLILGESGRSVFRASYGAFYDFGAFAGSSAGALFQATYPPFSVDNRFNSRGSGSIRFQQPFASTGPDPGSIVQQAVRYPIQVFDRDFVNSRAHHWNAGLQRLLPNGIFLSGIYVGTRSLRLQRQSELNEFVLNPLRSFTFVRQMRLLSAFNDVRQFESSGSGTYHGMQLRANRYLTRGLAFDVGYTYGQSHDNSSTVFGDNLATEAWAPSSYDRRHSIAASWVYQIRPPRSWSDRWQWLDRWRVAGVWRWRSGLPLDIRQTEDPTFTFQEVGRPDLIGEFRQLDPSVERTFTLQDGRTITGRFSFDPTVFAPVEPTNFRETRQGTVTRNQFRQHGFQQWDVRLGRPVSVGEDLSLDLSIDMINLFNNRNWARPFGNYDNSYFGVVRTEGVGRTFQAAIRLEF